MRTATDNRSTIQVPASIADIYKRASLYQKERALRVFEQILQTPGDIRAKFVAFDEHFYQGEYGNINLNTDFGEVREQAAEELRRETDEMGDEAYVALLESLADEG